MELLDLDEYCLVKLFSYLDCENIKNLFLVCKYFNELISKSLTLMGKLTLQVNCEKIESLSKSPYKKRQRLLDPEVIKTTSRKYSILHIINFRNKGDSLPPELDFLQHIKRIQYLFIVKTHITNEGFKAILRLFSETLTIVHIEKCQLHGESYEEDPVKFPILKELRVLFSLSKWLFHFHEAKIKTFTISCANEQNYVPFVKFLEVQHDLKVFNNLLNISLFEVSTLENTKFQLEELSVHFLDLSELSNPKLNECFKRFLRKQAASMKRLTLNGGVYNDSIFKLILNELPKLEFLSINCFFESNSPYNFESIRDNTSINKFILDFDDFCESVELLNLFKLIKNLKILEVANGYIDNFYQFEYPCLEHLKITGCSVKSQEAFVKNKTLERLKFIELRRVSVEFAKFLFSQHELAAVHTVIVDNYVDAELLRLVKQNCPNLVNLEVIFTSPYINRVMSGVRNSTEILNHLPQPRPLGISDR